MCGGKHAYCRIMPTHAHTSTSCAPRLCRMNFSPAVLAASRMQLQYTAQGTHAAACQAQRQATQPATPWQPCPTPTMEVREVRLPRHLATVATLAACGRSSGGGAHAAGGSSRVAPLHRALPGVCGAPRLLAGGTRGLQEFSRLLSPEVLAPVVLMCLVGCLDW